MDALGCDGSALEGGDAVGVVLEIELAEISFQALRRNSLVIASDAALALLKSWGMKPLEVLSGDWVMGWSSR